MAKTQPISVPVSPLYFKYKGKKLRIIVFVAWKQNKNIFKGTSDTCDSSFDKKSRPLDCIHTLKKDRKSTRLNSSHVAISYAVFCLKKKKQYNKQRNRIVKKRNGNNTTNELTERI